MSGQGFQIGKGFTVPAAFPYAQNYLSPALSNSSTGGSIPAGTYYVKMTWVTANGESLPFHTSEPNTTTTGTTSTITATNQTGTWPSGVTGINVYIGNASGQESLQATITGVSTGGSVTLTSLVAGKGVPMYNTTSFQDINPSAVGLTSSNEFIIQNLYYNNPIALGTWDGTTQVVFDGDTGNGVRQDSGYRCNSTQWLRVYNQSGTQTLQVSFDGVQTQ